MKIALAEQLAAAEREVKMRERVYARRVAGGLMTQAAAERGIAEMQAIAATLRGLVPPPAQGRLLG